MKVKILAIVAILAILAGSFMSWRLWAMQNELRNQRIETANARASADSSKLAIKAEGDTAVAVAERLAFQTEVRLREAFRDSVERMAQATARIRIEADSLRRVVEGAAATEDSVGNLTTTGRLDARDSLGIQVEAKVTIPADRTIKPVWTWRVWRGPIALELALSCQGDQAVAQLAGPPWLPLAIDSVAQRPELCIPPVRLRWNPFSLRIPSLPWAVGLGIAGYVLGSR